MGGGVLWARGRCPPRLGSHPQFPPRPPQACAPLQHWNALRGGREAFRTPVGVCYVGRAGSVGLRRLAWISPCRDVRMAASYRDTQYGEGGGGGGGGAPHAGGS